MNTLFSHPFGFVPQLVGQIPDPEKETPLSERRASDAIAGGAIRETPLSGRRAKDTILGGVSGLSSKHGGMSSPSEGGIS